MIQSLRGMNDIFIDDYERFEYFIKTATDVAKNYGFHYIETPILEETALFRRSVGESSDIVGKEMYQFIDKGENDVCMRPEGTAGVVRAFIEHKLDKRGGEYRFYYHGPMFRYERPQKGRLREFHQFGAESFGVSSVYEDANMIMMIADIFSRLGVDYRLKLNSLGDNNCMPQYREKLIEFIDSCGDNICEDCRRRRDTNPIRVLDCKNDRCQELYKNAPKLLDNLCDSCDSDFSKLQSILDKNSISYEIDRHLVRGLDYYSKSAFEFVSDEIGAQSAIAGGGRYDRLVEFLDGKATPAVGFAIGIERLLELIKMPESSASGYYLGAMEDEAIESIITLGMRLRKKHKTAIEYEKKSLKAHLKNADRAGSRYCCVIGSQELADSTIWIKDLVEKVEFIKPIDEVI